METGRRVLAEMALPACSKFKGRARSPSPSLSLTSTRGGSKEFPSPLFSFSLVATATHLPSKLSSLWRLDHNAMSKGLSLSLFLSFTPLPPRVEGQPRRDANSSLLFFFSSAVASPLSLLPWRIRHFSLLARACTLLLFFLLSLSLSFSGLSLSRASAHTRCTERETNSKSTGAGARIGRTLTTWVTPPIPASARHWLLFARRFSQPSAALRLRACVPTMRARASE